MQALRPVRYARAHGHDQDDRAEDRGPRAALAGDARAPRSERRRAARDHVPDRRGPARGRDAHRRRRQHLHRLHGRRRLPERRPLPSRTSSRRRRSSSTASPTPTSRSSRTRSTSTLAERLLARAPFSGPVKAAFFNAGTEAVENAVKFARAYTGRPAVIGFEGAFHGRTLLSLTLTSKTHPVQGRPRPVRARGLPRAVPERLPRRHAPPTRWRRSSGPSRPSSRAENVAAIVVEPVQGEGGFILAPAGVRRRACARSATSTGSCSSSTRCRPASRRTGRFFAIEHSGVEPDLITVAKSIAMRPAALGRARQGGDHGRARRRRRRRHLRRQPGRAGGRARRARRDRGRGARRALGRDRRDDPRAHARRGRSAGPQIGDVRGLGSMLAIELVADPATKAPAPELAYERDRGGASRAGCC